MISDYILADDLSGALEAGAAFRSRGWTVSLPLTEDAALPPRPHHVDVYSTETRNASPTQAAAIVRGIVMARRAAGARLLFKKIDSTLRGPIGAELSALIAELAPRLVVVCPANPLAGRTVMRGIVRVNDMPLEQTSFRADPAWPAETGDVRARLAAQGLVVHDHIGVETVTEGVAAISRHLAALRATAAGPLIVTSDALTLVNLRALVEGAIAIDPAAVLVGSGALGPVIAEQRPKPAGALPTEVGSRAGIVVFCGSRHPVSHQQIETLVRDGGALDLMAQPDRPMAPLIGRLVAGIDAGRAVAVRCDADAAMSSPDAIPRWLGEVAAALIAERRPSVIGLTGGETAFAVCRQIGGMRLDIDGEISQGVVRAQLIVPGQPALTVIAKPGGFGETTCWLGPRAMK